MANLADQFMKSEFGHLMPFIIICFISIYLMVIGSIQRGVVCLLINLLGNFYQVLLQRHHGMSIQMIIKRTATVNKMSN